MARLHVIGAGVAGLAAAARGIQLGSQVILYDSTSDIGGRLRALSHPNLSRSANLAWPVIHGGDSAILGLIELIGAGNQWQACDPTILFGEGNGLNSWTFTPGRGKSWLLDPNRCPPGVWPWHHLELLKLPNAHADETVQELLQHAEEGFPRLWAPLCRLLLNTSANEAAPKLLWTELKQALFSKHTPFAMTPIGTIEDALARPALAWLAQSGLELRLRRTLTDLDGADHRITSLFFGSEQLQLGQEDGVILALPPRQLSEILPELGTAPRMSPSVLVHFETATPSPFSAPKLIATVKSSEIWMIWQEYQLSVLMPAAKSLIGWPKQRLAELAWREAAPLLDLSTSDLPPFAVIKERRATVAHTPGAEQTRPGVDTQWKNLTIASGGTLTGVADRFNGSAVAGATAVTKLLEKLSEKAD